MTTIVWFGLMTTIVFYWKLKYMWVASQPTLYSLTLDSSVDEFWANYFKEYITAAGDRISLVKAATKVEWTLDEFRGIVEMVEMEMIYSLITILINLIVLDWKFDCKWMGQIWMPGRWKWWLLQFSPRKQLVLLEENQKIIIVIWDRIRLSLDNNTDFSCHSRIVCWEKWPFKRRRERVATEKSKSKSNSWFSIYLTARLVCVT